ncbi:FUSC family protein [Actinoallomurus bryophytorum]|uniref:Putative membrane protein YccC n=1 Tax=Actinoallomurus bryophytorum TaxID=1490222 RepID=A0A543BSL0_9ACTN|nr:FUSC family protein [Actinoallomurus bryophytorum]TQL87824.1 putative membrane protein YccC [Actinoallomurus bryophytorum]
MNVLGWLRTRDADLSALRRAGRAAVVMPAVFAIADKLLGNPTIATFAAFSGLSTLLFVDFGGSVRDRLAQQAGLVLTGAALVCVGTLASREDWLAALATLVVAFGVLFAGVVSSVLAGATTALLVGLVLPVTLPGSVGTIPDRLAGWLMGGAASMLAIAVMWPAPTREPLRLSTAQACALLARRLRAEVDCVRGGLGTGGGEALRVLADEATAAVTALRESFFATPYRPTGLTTATRTLVRLIDEVVWLGSVLERTPADPRPGPNDAQVCEVKLAAALLLERGAALLESVAGDAYGLEPDLHRLRQAREAMEHAVTSALPVRRVGDGVAEFVSSLEPSFRAQEMTFAISAIATNIELTVAARRRTWWQRLLGRRPEGVTSPLSSAQERAGAHIEPHSVWLHNSVRGAIALGLAVLVAEAGGVQHSFWVVFGTLAVLRSNALNTGQNALRALLGTVAGFIIGGLLVFAVGTGTTMLWVLLPPAIVFVGLAPAAISFTAGQAGFTVVLLILYNIIEPAGWRIGLVRIEDVAIGCAVSLIVGALFWPRGAGSALGRALSEAFSDSARYLRGAVEYGITRCDVLVPAAAGPDDQRRRAAAAARRLDDAFRGFLAERGTKHVPLADVTMLITGVAVLRLTADAILDLWARQDESPAGDRTTARTEIVEAGTLLAGWYEDTARALVGAGPVPGPLTHDKDADGRLIEAVRRDLTGEDGHATATAVRVIWTADHIDAARRLQTGILAPTRAVAAVWSSRRAWPSSRRPGPRRQKALTD